MNRASALLLSLVIAGGCVGACRRRASARRARRPTAVAAWFVTPSRGTPVRVSEGRYLAGARRVEGDVVAPPPYPVSRLVTSARVGSAWLFASERGAVFRAEGFLGALTLLATIPVRALELQGERASEGPRGVRGEGALLYLDEARRAWAVSASGAVRRLSPSGVLSGAFVSPRAVLLVVEPGVLLASDDGGETFLPAPLPSGVATRLTVRDDGVAVSTTEGTLRWRDGALAPWRVTPPLDRWLEAPPDVDRALLAHDQTTRVLPRDPSQATARADGSLAVVTSDEVLTLDPRTRGVRARASAPGSACTLHASGAGLRAVCTHRGWARAVFAEGPDGRWTVLRDESRDEPPGEVAFDDASAAWVVHAPCAASPEVDPRTFCFYRSGGGRREVRSPFDAVPVAMHRGTALLVETALSGDRTRAVLLRERELQPLTLPVRGAAAREGRWVGDALSFWDADDRGHPVLVRSEREGTAWRRTPAPEGAVGAVPGPRGTELAFGRTARSLWRSVEGVRFVPLPSPVVGSAEGLSLSTDEASYCVGAVCALGGALEWSGGALGQALALDRDTPLPTPSGPPLRPLRALRCRSLPTPSPVTPLAAVGAVVPASLQALALSVRELEGVPVVALSRRDASGVLRPRRVYAVAAPPGEVFPGSLDGGDGVFVAERALSLRFLPAEGAANRERFPALTGETPGCQPGSSGARGGLRVTARVPLIVGQGWRAEPPTWDLEAILRVEGPSTCLEALRGRASPGAVEEVVQTLSLATEGGGSFRGTATGEGGAWALRCAFVEEPGGAPTED